MSTIFGVLVLAFINSYMVLVFFKTIFLVLVIGIFHALILLPIVLYETAPFTDRFTTNRISLSETSSTNLTVDSSDTTITQITQNNNYDKLLNEQCNNQLIKNLKINKKLSSHLLESNNLNLSKTTNYQQSNDRNSNSVNICTDSTTDNLFKSIIFLGAPPPSLQSFNQLPNKLNTPIKQSYQNQDQNSTTTKLFINGKINNIYRIQ